MTIKPYYEHSIADTGNIHEFETVSFEYKSYCETRDITQSSGAATTLSQYITDTGITHTIPAFESTATTLLPTECAMTYSIDNGSSTINPTFSFSDNVLTVPDLDNEAMIGTWPMVLTVSYLNYPAFTSEKFQYSFDFEVLSVCTRDTSTPVQSDTSISTLDMGSTKKNVELQFSVA